MELTILKVCFEVLPEARWNVSDSFKDLCHVRGYPQRAAKKILKLAARHANSSRQIVVADAKTVNGVLENLPGFGDIIRGVSERICFSILNHNCTFLHGNGRVRTRSSSTTTNRPAHSDLESMTSIILPMSVSGSTIQEQGKHALTTTFLLHREGRPEYPRPSSDRIRSGCVRPTSRDRASR